MPIELIHISLGIAFLLVWTLIAEILLRNQMVKQDRAAIASPKRQPPRPKIRNTKPIRAGKNAATTRYSS